MIIPLPYLSSTLTKRLIPGLIAMGAAALAIVCSTHSQLYLLPTLAILGLGYFGAIELAALFNRMGERVQPRLIVFAALAPAIGCSWAGGQAWAIVLGAFLALALPVALAMRQSNQPLSTWTLPWMALLYIGLPLAILEQQVVPRLLAGNGEIARWQLLFFLLAVKGGDIGSFFVGHYLGRNRLSSISPGKTWEGAFGGLLSSLALCLLLAILWPLDASIHWLHLGLSALVLGFFAQAGDLFESYLKRMARVKDSGQLVGLGGILDLLDSPLVASYLFAILLRAGWL